VSGCCGLNAKGGGAGRCRFKLRNKKKISKKKRLIISRYNLNKSKKVNLINSLKLIKSFKII